MNLNGHIIWLVELSKKSWGNTMTSIGVSKARSMKNSFIIVGLKSWIRWISICLLELRAWRWEMCFKPVVTVAWIWVLIMTKSMIKMTQTGTYWVLKDSTTSYAILTRNLTHSLIMGIPVCLILQKVRVGALKEKTLKDQKELVSSVNRIITRKWGNHNLGIAQIRNQSAIIKTDKLQL